MGTRNAGMYHALIKTTVSKTIRDELKKETTNLLPGVIASTPLKHATYAHILILSLHPIPLASEIAILGYATYKGIKTYKETEDPEKALKSAGLTPRRVFEYSTEKISETMIQDRIITEGYHNLNGGTKNHDHMNLLKNVTEDSIW